MRCPEWTFRTSASGVSGEWSGAAWHLSGVSVSPCPESRPDATPDTRGLLGNPMSGGEGGH